MTSVVSSRYDYRFDPDDESSTAARICRLVGHEHNVLELGCAAGAMTAVLAHHYGCKVTGVEYDVAAAEQAAKYAEQVHVASLADPDWVVPLAGKRFDTVLAADVLEHLSDPAACLRQLHGLLTDAGRLVVSVPNIGNGGVIASLLAGEFNYQDVGLLDRTHVHFFTPASLGQMLHQNGFVVEQETASLAGSWHLEFAEHWKRLPPSLAEWLERSPGGQVYQAIVVARRADALGAYQWQPRQTQTEWLQEFARQETALAARLEAALAVALEVEQEARRNQAELEAQLGCITTSLSWRLTAPLRYCKSVCLRVWRSVRGKSA